MSNESGTRPVVLTCAQPTNNLHIGNLLGAIGNWVKFLDDHDCYFGLVDLHAITVPYVPADLRRQSLDCVAQYIAAGLDPERCHIFLQSHVIGHTELAWVLGAITPVGQLQRMTQFKDKAARQEGFVGAGLLTYPVLMAADILLYNADVVPVGEDQKQHLELTRDIAQKFNTTYSETFKVPEIFIPRSGARVMSLQDPGAKMSKSDPNQNATVFLLDPPDRVRRKIMSAVTDSGSEIVAREDKPGISNLLSILSGATGIPVAELEAEFAGVGYGDFKKAVADAVIALLEPIQERYREVSGDREVLAGILAKGAAAAQKRAYRMLSKVYRKAGFVERAR